MQDDGSAVCRDPKNSLFHDLPEEEAEEWQSKLQVQPALEHWKVPVPYCGWKDVPSTYIVCELDRLLPVHVQEKMSALASSEVVRLQAGHMVQLSQPDAVAKIISEAVSAR
jgi:pimeloyl-ACP methyl ester carboxylesterase